MDIAWDRKNLGELGIDSDYICKTRKLDFLEVFNSITEEA